MSFVKTEELKMAIEAQQCEVLFVSKTGSFWSWRKQKSGKVVARVSKEAVAAAAKTEYPTHDATVLKLVARVDVARRLQGIPFATPFLMQEVYGLDVKAAYQRVGKVMTDEYIAGLPALDMSKVKFVRVKSGV